jgi:hypothetical protein
VTDPTAWIADAACAGVTGMTDLDRHGAGSKALIRQYCARCPVIELCAALARDVGNRYLAGRHPTGVWGGRYHGWTPPDGD